MKAFLPLCAAGLLALAPSAHPQELPAHPDPRHFLTPTPPYPLQAAKQHMGGRIVLRVFFPPAGPPLKVEVQRSSGFALLDGFAVSWARTHYTSRGLAEAPARPVLVPLNFLLR